MQYVPWGDMIKKYLAGVAAGDVPDVFHSSIAFARDLWDQGTLQELSEYIRTTPDMAEETFMPATTPYRNDKGSWFAMPWEGFDGRALYYNVEHFEEAGLEPDFVSVKLWGWDDLLEASQKLTAFPLARRLRPICAQPPFHPGGAIAQSAGAIPGHPQPAMLLSVQHIFGGITLSGLKGKASSV